MIFEIPVARFPAFNKAENFLTEFIKMEGKRRHTLQPLLYSNKNYYFTTNLKSFYGRH